MFSLSTQAYGIGGNAATVAAQLDMSPGVLIACLLPHALPELTALFLPLAAWLIASRTGRWEELLAATVVTVSLAIPVLLASAAVELYVTPELLERPVRQALERLRGGRSRPAGTSVRLNYVAST